MRVKFCGLRSRGDVAAAADAGGFYAGFVFFPPSPRNISLADARWVAGEMPEGVTPIALTVDADDATFDEILGTMSFGMLQLHGRESPERVAELRKQYGLPVIKALGVADQRDLAALERYEEVVDMLLVDALPPSGAELPGGNGLTFDWRLLQGRDWKVPWMLAGGLTPENVGEAVRLTGADQVDVSSGVEKATGIKDHRRMAVFAEAARQAAAARNAEPLDGGRAER